MKHVQACLSARKNRESSFLPCGCPTNLVLAYLCWGKTWKSRFNRRGGSMKYVQACLSARKDRQSSFHHCGRPVKLVQACLCAGKTS